MLFGHLAEPSPHTLNVRNKSLRSRVEQSALVNPGRSWRTKLPTGTILHVIRRVLGRLHVPCKPSESNNTYKTARTLSSTTSVKDFSCHVGTVLTFDKACLCTRERDYKKSERAPSVRQKADARMKCKHKGSNRQPSGSSGRAVSTNNTES